MNDPHVTALHYWVNHDDSVDYTDADPLQYEHELFHLEANRRNVPHSRTTRTSPGATS